MILVARKIFPSADVETDILRHLSSLTTRTRGTAVMNETGSKDMGSVCRALGSVQLVRHATDAHKKVKIATL